MPSAGEIWAYRSGGRKPLTPVSVEEIADNRAHILFLDLEMAGAMEWVPIGRLQVPWEAREAFLEREARWDALNGPERASTGQREAAWDIFMATIPTEIAEIYYNNAYGTTEIHDLKRLSDLTGLRPDQIAAYETAFVEDGALHVPWEATRLIATAMASRAGGRLLRRIEAEERQEAGERAERAESLTEWENPSEDSNWERRLAFWRESQLERRETIRLWAGNETPDVADELAALRAHLETLITLAQRASAELPQARTKRATAVKNDIDAVIREIRGDV